MLKGREKSTGRKCMNISGLGWYPIIDRHSTDNQIGFVEHLVCFSFLYTDIAENLSFFWLLLSLLCFSCFASIFFTFSFFSPSVAFFSSVLFFLLFSFQQHFSLLCSDSLFIKREIWKRNGQGVFPLPHQRSLADTEPSLKGAEFGS